MKFVRTLVHNSNGEMITIRVHNARLDKLYLTKILPKHMTEEELETAFEKLETRLEEYINISSMFKHLRDVPKH